MCIDGARCLVIKINMGKIPSFLQLRSSRVVSMSSSYSCVFQT